MISEIKKQKNAFGCVEVVSFTLYDLQNNIIRFNKLDVRDVYVGNISEIKNIQLPVLTTIQCFNTLMNINAHHNSTTIDVKYDLKCPAEGIITIYNEFTEKVPKGYLTINEKDTVDEMNSREQTMFDTSNLMDYFFKENYIFDIGILAKHKHGEFHLQTKLISTQYVSYRLKARMFFSKYFYFIFILILSFIIYIVETYYASNVFIILYEKLINYYHYLLSSPPSSSSSSSSSPDESNYNFLDDI